MAATEAFAASVGSSPYSAHWTWPWRWRSQRDVANLFTKEKFIHETTNQVASKQKLSPLPLRAGGREYEPQPGFVGWHLHCAESRPPFREPSSRLEAMEWRRRREKSR